MAYKREMPISVSIDITLKEEDIIYSEVFPFLSGEPNENFFRFCLSVLLEQDGYGEEEIEEATRIIRELTNHEDGFNITSQAN